MVRMHLARADRASTRSTEIVALRDAVYWAREDHDLLMQARPALALALLAQCEAEGIATERDRERVREAATLLRDSKRFSQAGDAFARAGDSQAAVEAYRAGGLVAKLERALNIEEKERERGRAERNDYADYQMYLRGGQRDEALQALRECIEAADSSSEYRRKLDELETRLITVGLVRLRSRRGTTMAITSSSEVFLGRDPTCELVLRSSGTSRRHACIAQGETPGFALSDAGSRNGTRIAGMAIETSLPLEGLGRFQLGGNLEVHYNVSDSQLHLSIESGLDAGSELWVTAETADIELAPLGVEAALQFRNGRPFLRSTSGALLLNDAKIALGEAQLMHGDSLVLGALEIEVL